MSRNADEFHVDRIIADLRVKPNGARVRYLVPHREEERAVTRDRRRLPHGYQTLARVRAIAEIAATVAPPEHGIACVHASRAGVVDDDIPPPQRVGVARGDRVTVHDKDAHIVHAARKRSWSR